MPHRHARGAGEREPDASPLPGVLSFRPRLPAILLLLTVTVAVVGYRITRYEGGREGERVAREALSAWSEWGAAPGGETPPKAFDPAPAVLRAVGVPVPLPPPGGEGEIGYLDARKRGFGKERAATVRFTAGGGRYLLLLVRRGRQGGADGADAFFSGPSFRSGTRGGLSFVYWVRGGVEWCLVTDRDLAECIDLARERFLPAPSR